MKIVKQTCFTSSILHLGLGRPPLAEGHLISICSSKYKYNACAFIELCVRSH